MLPVGAAMLFARACAALAILLCAASCGGESAEPEPPRGELVLARGDLRHLVGDTAQGDMIVVTDDGSVLALDHGFVSSVVSASLGRLGTDFHIDVAGGAVLLWRRRADSSWELSAWTRARGLRLVGSDLDRPAPTYTRASVDGERIVFATGGYFENGHGTALTVYGQRLSRAPEAPIQLARMPADRSTGWVEVALIGEHAIVKRATERALRQDLEWVWPESEEPWEAVWFDAEWKYRGAVPHAEDLSLGDAGLRVVTGSADGSVTLTDSDGANAIVVDQGCRFANPFLLSGDAAVVYSCRGTIYKLDVATRVRTTLGTGPRAYPLKCGDTRCRDWIGLGANVVSVETGATLAVPPDATSYSELSPDGRFAKVPATEGAISLVAVGTMTPRVVLDPEARFFSWLDGARFTYAMTEQTSTHNRDAHMTVRWRDADAERDQVIAQAVLTPLPRAKEHALYAIVRAPDQPIGLYRFSMPN